MPILSILLPTYNGVRFLRPQMDSILAQTDGDFELVAIDDGSSDDTVSILDEYVRLDKRVHRLPSVGNIGQRLRLRDLVMASTSRYVAIADQDDIWSADRNTLLLASIGERAIAFGRSQLIDGEAHDLGQSILERLKVDPRNIGPLEALFQPLVSAHAAIIRRDWIDPATFSGPVPFDWMMGIEALLSSGLVYVDEAVVRHRIHGDNQMNAAAFSFKAKLVSRHQLRLSTAFRSKDRFYLFLVLDQLSRSSTLSAADRRRFVKAADACRYAWYHRLEFSLKTGSVARRQLHDALDLFASSERDLAYFSDKVDAVTSPAWTPANLARAVRTYAEHL